jgi:hypothetical protein
MRRRPREPLSKTTPQPASQRHCPLRNYFTSRRPLRFHKCSIIARSFRNFIGTRRLRIRRLAAIALVTVDDVRQVVPRSDPALVLFSTGKYRWFRDGPGFWQSSEWHLYGTSLTAVGVCLAVPELTRASGIQLNGRVSLPPRPEAIGSSALAFGGKNGVTHTKGLDVRG